MDVHRRRQQQLAALGARLLGQGHPHAFDQLRVPGGGERSATGEAGGGGPALVPTASGAAGTVRHLDGWDAEARDAGAVPEVRAGEHRDLLLEAHAAEQFVDPIRHGSSAGRWHRKRREPGGAHQPARSAGQVKSASQPVPPRIRSTAARSSEESAARPSPEPAETLGLVGKALLHPGASVDLTLDLLLTALERRGVGQQEGDVDASHLGEQGADGLAQFLPRRPIRLRDLQAAEILQMMEPGDHPRRLAHRDGGGGGIEERELAELAEESEVRGAGTVTHQEGLHLKMRVQERQQAAIALLDGRPGDFVGSHHCEAPHLPLAERLGEPCQLLGGRGDVPVDGQDQRGLLHVLRVGPAIVEHRFGEPLVGVILDQCVEKGDCRIRMDHPALAVALLEAADLRRRVDHRLIASSAAAGKDENRNQRDWNLGNPHVLRRAAPDPAEGNPSVAQHGSHLAAVGRSVAADELEGGSAHESPSPRAGWSPPPYPIHHPKPKGWCAAKMAAEEKSDA